MGQKTCNSSKLGPVHDNSTMRLRSTTYYGQGPDIARMLVRPMLRHGVLWNQNGLKLNGYKTPLSLLNLMPWQIHATP